MARLRPEPAGNAEVMISATPKQGSVDVALTIKYDDGRPSHRAKWTDLPEDLEDLGDYLIQQAQQARDMGEAGLELALRIAAEEE